MGWQFFKDSSLNYEIFLFFEVFILGFGNVWRLEWKVRSWSLDFILHLFLNKHVTSFRPPVINSLWLQFNNLDLNKTCFPECKQCCGSTDWYGWYHGTGLCADKWLNSVLSPVCRFFLPVIILLYTGASVRYKEYYSTQELQ